MGKRSNFKRRKADAYDTPAAAVLPLYEFLPSHTFGFYEPCAGKHALVDHIVANAYGARCYGASDIKPRDSRVIRKSALDVNLRDLCDCDLIITNPPWVRNLLHPMIEHFAVRKPTWLLLDADWKHTLQAAPYMEMCLKIVSVGRVKWIEGSKNTGKDNCAWYLFDYHKGEGKPIFYARKDLD